MTVVQELTALDRAIDAGTQRLLELQHPGGWWVGELESNATMIAEHLFWLHYTGLRDPRTDRKLANELFARRREDGTWSNWFEGPADLSTTIESYVALKMAGIGTMLPGVHSSMVGFASPGYRPGGSLRSWRDFSHV